MPHDRDLPLDIELAATWVRIMLCSNIERNLDFLSSTRKVPDRHRDIRAMFDYS